MQQVDEDNCVRGLIVRRGPGWQWDAQDGGVDGIGIVLRKFYMTVGDDFPQRDALRRQIVDGRESNSVPCLNPCSLGTMGDDWCRTDLLDWYDF